MSRPYRGRGHRGGFRGRGNYGGDFRPPPPSADPNCFSVHPCKRFETVGLKSENLEVEEIGFYSLEGEGKDVTPRYDRSAMRSVTTKCSPEIPVDVSFNLDDPFSWENFGTGYASINEFGPMYTWMKDEGGNDLVQSKRDRIDFITSKGILSELAKIPYNQDSQDANGWIFGAAKVNGKIVIGKVERSGTDKVFLKNHAAAQHDLEMKPGTFRGRRFEIRMTLAEGNNFSLLCVLFLSPFDLISKATPEGHIGFSPFRSILNVKLKDLNLLVESGVDAADPECKDDYPKKYVEFTILPVQMLAAGATYKVARLYNERFLRWWANSVFIGLGSVKVGVHNDGHVSQLRAYRLADIPKIVKTKESELEQPLWSDAVCLGFLYELLKYVQRFVQEDHKTMVYEFTCPKITCAFSCKAIPADHPAAKDHTYLPADAVDF